MLCGTSMMFFQGQQCTAMHDVNVLMYSTEPVWQEECAQLARICSMESYAPYSSPRLKCNMCVVTTTHDTVY